MHTEGFRASLVLRKSPRRSYREGLFTKTDAQRRCYSKECRTGKAFLQRRLHSEGVKPKRSFMKGCYQDDRSGNALFTKIIAQEKCVFTKKAVHERIYSKMIFYERYFYQDGCQAKVLQPRRSYRKGLVVQKNVYYQVVSSSKGFKAQTVAQAKYFMQFG